MNGDRIPHGASQAAEANALTLKKLIVEVTGLIRSSKDVLARLEGPDTVQSYPGMERRASRAPTRVEQTTDSCPDEERRRTEELPPDIITLIVSCGERIRKTDSIELRT